MCPFPKTTIVNDTKKKFIERLSRTRRVVENAFGILTQKWRIFLRLIDVEVKTATNVKVACLHNFMVHCLSESCQDNKTEVQMKVQTKVPHHSFLLHQKNRRATNAAFEVRDHFVNLRIKNVN